MSYRDDLIAELKEAGTWTRMGPDMREVVEHFDDDQACAFLRMLDEAELRQRGRAIDLSSADESIQAEAVNEILVSGFVALSEAFGGGLWHADPPDIRVTELGKLLVRFIAAAESQGFKLREISDDLGKLNLASLMLLTWYSGDACDG